VATTSTITKVERFSVDVPDQPGEGARVLEALAAGKVNLVAAWGYPLGGSGTSRIELVSSDSAALRAAARNAKVKLNRESAAFHVSGPDKPGAVASAARKLADAGVNIHAVQAVSSGSKYGCLIEVAAQDVRKAAKALGV
jgi:hypothetical protein